MMSNMKEAEAEQGMVNPMMSEPRTRGSIMTVLNRVDERTGRISHVIAFGGISTLFLLATIFGLTLAATEYAKETHVENGHLVAAQDGEALTTSLLPVRSKVSDLADYAEDPVEEIAARVALDSTLVTLDDEGVAHAKRISAASVRETEEDVTITYFFHDNTQHAVSLRQLVDEAADAYGDDEAGVASRRLLGVSGGPSLGGQLMSSAFPDCKALHGPGWCYNAFTGKCKSPCRPPREWPSAASSAGSVKKDCPPNYYYNYRMKKCWPRLVVDEKLPPASSN